MAHGSPDWISRADTAEAPSSYAYVAQITVGVAATEISSVSSTRRSIVIVNNSNSDIYLGKDNTVTDANGILLAAGANFAINGYTGAIWGIAELINSVVSLWEM